ncbi:MAG TPA: F0F1 ATP synthase subunit B [Candidatus Saccharimonadales bacterium]|nr:F0F1 ATP synthase subunit B [Candidatus Saccharimonadales bacterium]
MVNVLAQLAVDPAESGILGLNVQAFVVQLITFILAIVVLERFAVKPILKVLEHRRQTIEKGVKLGEQMQQDKADLDQKVAEELHKTRAKADQIIADAEAAAKRRAGDIEAKAKDKADSLVASAEDRIGQETAAARRKLESEMAELVASAAGAVLREKVDVKKDAQVIAAALEQEA